MLVNHSIIETLKLFRAFLPLFELSLIMIQIYCSAIRKTRTQNSFQHFQMGGAGETSIEFLAQFKDLLLFRFSIISQF